MADPDYLIENCTAEDFEFACPKKWSELKPSMMAAVRDCHHCRRKVYLCTTDADLKIYTSLGYCIAVIKPQTQAEKEAKSSTNSMRPTGGKSRQFNGEVLMGIPARGTWPGPRRPLPDLKFVSEDPATDEIPKHQRMPLPDKDEPK